jgi:HNH endonuclease
VRPAIGEAVADPTFRARFLARVAAGPADQCWEWSGYRNRGDSRRRINNYGVVFYRGSSFKAHRVAYVIARGALPKDLLVLHTCDNPPCCNPRHLVTGDQSLNMRHMTDRRRHPGIHLLGERHPAAKLTADQVREIRARREAGETCAAIAADFGVTYQLVWLITRNRIWRHVA